jgi:hypothetical protein
LHVLPCWRRFINFKLRWKANPLGADGGAARR